MESNSRRYTVRFEPSVYQQVEAAAARLKTSPADVIRRAVLMLVRGDRSLTDSDLRHHRISEFSQVALDTIIREQHPEMIEAIVSETNRRMERYHGAR